MRGLRLGCRSRTGGKLEINLTSVFELCRLAANIMIPRGSGKIATIASMLSFSGGFQAAAYSASKGGVAQLTKALANEVIHNTWSISAEVRSPWFSNVNEIELSLAM